jgi:hypothetical protein
MSFRGPKPENVGRIRARFEQYLRRAVDGGGGFTHSGSWFDVETTIALERVAAEYPDPDPALIAAGCSRNCTVGGAAVR